MINKSIDRECHFSRTLSAPLTSPAERQEPLQGSVLQEGRVGSQAVRSELGSRITRLAAEKLQRHHFSCFYSHKYRFIVLPSWKLRCFGIFSTSGFEALLMSKILRSAGGRIRGKSYSLVRNSDHSYMCSLRSTTIICTYPCVCLLGMLNSSL